ncbi:MAG: hypothetical protein MI824_24570, partial [Hyphomicrobiales bacterium]|nr:hypothetical protein [Hyphomicrobiales bacterium]
MDLHGRRGLGFLPAMLRPDSISGGLLALASSSCPDVIRASIPLAPQRDREANGMDCRVKPGNDDGWLWAALESRTPLRLRGNDGEGA